MEKGKEKGYLHPITQMTRELVSIFSNMGFSLASGPEMETEYYNFDALNIPKDHPARDMQDTFWTKPVKGRKENTLLRTHTSPVQIRYMENHKPPIRIIAPGRVFRNEATDATHEAQFYQIEALYVDKNVSMAHLKGTLEEMFKKIFGNDVEIRFRPSFFPFTEPSVEVDMKFKGKWLEIGGAGLVHPKVLQNAGIDPKEYSGFAFGFGIDRIIILKYDITDIRFLFNGDLRLVNQF